MFTLKMFVSDLLPIKHLNVTANINISKGLPSEYLQMKLFLELQL